MFSWNRPRAAADAAEPPADPVAAPVATPFRRNGRRVSPHFPVEYYCLAGVVLRGPYAGSRNGRPIHQNATDEDGTRYRFSRIAPRDPEGRLDVSGLAAGEWIVRPDLIYVEDHFRTGRSREEADGSSLVSREDHGQNGWAFRRWSGLAGQSSVVTVLIFATGGILLALL